METADQVLGEYEFTTASSKTGRMIHQLFFGRLVAQNGEISLLRESISLVELSLAIYPNGLADFKANNRSLNIAPQPLEQDRDNGADQDPNSGAFSPRTTATA